MRSFAFFVPGQPMPQGAIRPVVVRGRLRGVHKDGKRLQPWRNAVTWEGVRARGARPLPFPKPQAVSLYAVFYMRRPQRPKAPWPITMPDLQHLVRAIEDAVTGILYEDDSQIVHLDVRKEYAEGTLVPGVTIVVQGFDPAEVRSNPASEGARIAQEPKGPAH